MPRATLDLQSSDGLSAVQGQWRFATGLVPGEPNEGLVAQLEGSDARLPDYDDSGWERTDDLARWRSKGFSFIWYRTKITLPGVVGGVDVRGSRCLVETCIDDYGEIWVDGKCDLDRGAIQGFNVPQRVVVNADVQPGDTHTLALLAVNGPLAAPGGAVFIRYVTLAFEWRSPDY